MKSRRVENTCSPAASSQTYKYNVIVMVEAPHACLGVTPLRLEGMATPPAPDNHIHRHKYTFVHFRTPTTSSQNLIKQDIWRSIFLQPHGGQKYASHTQHSSVCSVTRALMQAKHTADLGTTIDLTTGKGSIMYSIHQPGNV